LGIEVSNVHYFAFDGSYGSADNISFIETDKWTMKEFNMVEKTDPEDRRAFAIDIALWVSLGKPKDFWTKSYKVSNKYRT
jgi:hypothetical protein